MDQDKQIASSAESKPKYGHVGNGEYNTPYQTTVIYHEDSMFETAVAFLADRAQVIPLTKDVDYEAVADSCEYLTPEVLIFGTDFSRSAIEKFFTRGFHFVHVFGDASKYFDRPLTDSGSENTENKETTENTENTENTKNTTYNLFTPNMAVFDHQTLYEHVVLVPGLAPIHALDYIMAATFPNYTPIINGVNYVDGKLFCEYFDQRKLHIGQELLKLTISFRGFDEISNIITSQRAAAEARERLASERLSNGLLFTLDDKSAIAVYGGDLMNEMLNLAPVHPNIVKNNVSFVLCWMLGETKTKPSDQHTLHVTLIGIKDAPSALETLRSRSIDQPHGTYGVAKATCTIDKFSF